MQPGGMTFGEWVTLLCWGLIIWALVNAVFRVFLGDD